MGERVRFAEDLERMAAGMELYRMRIHARRLIGEIRMTIEIKGLGATVQRARDAINLARAASSDLETEAGAFAADANEITAEIKKHHSDLLFEAQTLGNSPPPAKQQAQQPAPLPSVPEKPVPEVPAAKPTFPQAVDPGAAA